MCAMADIALSLKQIIKDFPGVRALDKASLALRTGEVHGLVGENGAGKSTIIKILAGVYSADEGGVEIFGRTLQHVTPKSVHDAGVRFIHQELHLVPHFTVTESVFMGQEQGGLTGLSKAGMRAKTEAYLREKLAVSIPGGRLVRDLSTAERKLVQIARALIDGEARIVVFDEPTAPLASEEVHTLMKAIARLKADGISIIYISHYLEEITSICDRVTVFRQGRDVALFDEITENTGTEMVSAMVGREIDTLYPTSTRVAGESVFTVEALSDGEAFQNISFSIGSGEIFGIAGGRQELIDCLYGLRRIKHGRISRGGKTVKISSAAQAVRHGIVLVPRDRRNDGLVLPMNVAEKHYVGDHGTGYRSLGCSKRLSQRMSPPNKSKNWISARQTRNCPRVT